MSCGGVEGLIKWGAGENWTRADMDSHCQGIVIPSIAHVMMYVVPSNRTALTLALSLGVTPRSQPVDAIMHHEQVITDVVFRPQEGKKRGSGCRPEMPVSPWR